MTNEEKKNEKKNVFAEAKSFWHGVGEQAKEHKMLKVAAGTALGVLGLAAIGVATVFGIKKLKGGKDDEIVVIPDDTNETTEE